MLFRLTTKDAVLNHVATMPVENWQKLTTAIAWFHRNGMTLDDVPESLFAIAETVLDPEAWRDFRREVKRVRLKHALEVKRLKTEASEYRRREYMRTYMARRRRKERP